MKLRSNLFVVILTLLTVFTIIFLSVNCEKVFAQDKTGKSAAIKESAVKPKNTVMPLVTFIEIGAAKCIPCKMMQPIMKEVGEEYKGQVKVLFHDVWTEKGKMDAAKYNIRVIPTQVFLDRDAKEYYRHEGYYPKDDVVRVIKMQGVK